MRYFIVPRTKKYVKEYGFLSLAGNSSNIKNNYWILEKMLPKK